ncbi:Probable lipid-A-disaccharide synthase, mitochondrial, partial [Linum perenne]
VLDLSVALLSTFPNYFTNPNSLSPVNFSGEIDDCSPNISTSYTMLLRISRTVKNQPAAAGVSFLPRRRNFSVSNSAAKDGELRVFLVAGEVSGDSIGSRLMSSLKKLSPFPVRFSGVGGSMMCREGLDSLFPIEDISVMGLWELLPHLNKFRIRLRETVDAAVLFRPHCVVTVDSKGFSFRFLKQLRGSGSSKSAVHFHYVAPSFWAWKGGEARLKGLIEFVDHVFCILPHEASVCQLNGLAATFVGHPVLEDLLQLNPVKGEWRIQGNADDFRCRFGVSKVANVISLLPGSRLQEVTRMLPIFTSAMDELRRSFPELLPVIHVAPNQDVEDFVGRVISRWPSPAVLVPGGDSILKYDAFSASKVALCTSGTVAVELQLARLPFAVAYRAHILTEWFIRYKAKIQYISLPNIVTDSPVIPECLFRSCTPANLAAILTELLRNENRQQEEQIAAAEKVIGLLFPSEGFINDRSFLHCSPSMIAAKTVLTHVKLAC